MIPSRIPSKHCRVLLIITSGGPLYNLTNYQSLTEITIVFLRFISWIDESGRYIFRYFGCVKRTL